MKRLEPEVEREVRRLAAKGHKLREIGRMLGCSRHAVTNTLRRPPRPPSPTAWNPSPARLSLDEREEIRVGLERGDTFTAIAKKLGRAVSTVSREVKANGGRDAYRAHLAHQAAFEQARRPKSPEAGLPASGRPGRRVARAVVVPGADRRAVAHRVPRRSDDAGEPRDDLPVAVRRGPRPAATGALPLSAHRPDTAPATQPHRDPRQDPRDGHDLRASRRGRGPGRARPLGGRSDHRSGPQSAVGTLVERTSRFVLLLHLPDGREAIKVNDAMKTAIADLPAELMRTITWDQGREMARHVDFTVDTGVQVYFCDPHSPWQRPSNENTNGLLRQYLRKGTDLSQHSAEDLAEIARSLNNRPRKTLGFMKPSEKLAELLAPTG